MSAEAVGSMQSTAQPSEEELVAKERQNSVIDERPPNHLLRKSCAKTDISQHAGRTNN